MRVLPNDESLVEGVEAAAGQGCSLDRQGFLIALGVCEIQDESVGDPTAFSVFVLLQRLDHFFDEVVGHGLMSMGEDHVDVAALGFTSSVAADDYGFDIGVCDEARVLADGGGDGFDFGPGDFEQKFVVVLQADLLHARQRLPAIFDDIVQVPPAVVVVEFLSCFSADTPNFVEVSEDFELGVIFKFGDGSNFAIGGLVFMEEMGDLLIATRQS